MGITAAEGLVSILPASAASPRGDGPMCGVHLQPDTVASMLTSKVQWTPTGRVSASLRTTESAADRAD